MGQVMSYDARIDIFGKVSNPEAMWDVATEASIEGRVEWMFDLTREKFDELLEQAARDGTALTITRRDTSEIFEDLRSSCQAAGLSYVIQCGYNGAEEFNKGLSWNPGMDKEFNFLIAGGKYMTLYVSEVQRAAKQGIEAVNALVDNIMANTHIGKIEFEPGYAEAYQAFADKRKTRTERSQSPSM